MSEAILAHLFAVSVRAVLAEIDDLDEFELEHGVEPVDAITEALIRDWVRIGVDRDVAYPIAYDAVANALLGRADAA